MQDTARQPGMGYSQMLARSTHRKQHFFDYKNGMPVINPPPESVAGLSARTHTSTGLVIPSRPVSAVYAPSHRSLEGSNRAGLHSAGSSRGILTDRSSKSDFIPTFAALDRKVLRFDAHFAEAIPNSPYESERFRKCTILYYLVDDSVQISEDKVVNSGLAQGAFLKRHKISTPSGHITWKDFQVGGSITLYGREFTISKCDAFTQEFYASNGCSQPDSTHVPQDSYTIKRAEFAKPPQKVPRAIDWNLRKKLNNPFSKKCLRFFAIWDDRASQFGEKRPYVTPPNHFRNFNSNFFHSPPQTVNFFLEDETMEVLEVKQPNAGREGFPRMLRRQRVPKSFEHLSDLHGSHYIVTDLKVGNTIKVFGREMFLYGCDDSTKQFYLENFGYQEADFPDLLDAVKEPEKVYERQPPPPHTGIGLPEDSLQSVLLLVPKAPRKNVAKILKFEGMVIRWQAALKSDKAEDAGRKFVISLNLADDAISVFEPPQK